VAKFEKYVFISAKHSSKPFVDAEGMKINWCGKTLKVLGPIPGAWIVKNWRQPK
jgi:hypothetical protein